MNFKDYINESSLSRLWRHNEEHDCGAMTAFRSARDCGQGDPYTTKENEARNKSLLAKLKSRGYGVTKLKGYYPEGDRNVKEESFFVVDLKDTGNLLKDLKLFGKEFEQDSILFISMGSIKGEDNAFLIGTNHCENNWLRYDQKEIFNKGRIGYNSPIYTSYVNGRPFIFEEYDREILNPGNGMGWWALSLFAKKHWKEFL